MTSGAFLNTLNHRWEKKTDISTEFLPSTKHCGRKALYCHLTYHNSIWESRKFLQLKILLEIRGERGKQLEGVD